MEISKNELNEKLIRILCNHHQFSGFAEWRRLLCQNGIRFNNKPLTLDNQDMLLTEDDFIDGEAIVTVGKKTHIIMRLV